jgi:N4-bis(aminopropyl)spermidine synthase
MPVDGDAVTSASEYPIDRMAARLAEMGAYGTAYREVLATLLTHSGTLAEIVSRTNVPRAVVEETLRLVQADVESCDGGLSLRSDRHDQYRERFALGQARPQESNRPMTQPDLSPTAVGLVRTMSSIKAAAPRPLRALDHVPATPQTAVRRALWMDGTFDLSGATVLCIGDHDLTSVALCLLNPEIHVVVVDIADDVLEFIANQALANDLDIRTVYADFRFGLPTVARGTADVVFTDPPYTPEGVQLFLTRGLQGIKDRKNGRLLMAYGFGDHQPSLGLKVQNSVGALSLAYEAILPNFNQYDGAQAIGSASDLYVCRPTPATWRLIDRSARSPVNIYTHGNQALESEGSAGSTVAPKTSLLEAAAGPSLLDVNAYVTANQPTADLATVGLGLGAVLDGTGQSFIKNSRTSAVAVDLTDDPGSWLARTLLGVNALRLAVMVTNSHPDVANRRAQDSLGALVEGKWRLRFRRSTPDSRHAIIEAEQSPLNELSAPQVARRIVLEGAHRKLRNVWLDALVKATRRAEAGGVTREGARAVIAGPATSDDILDGPLIDLPLHLIRQTLQDVSDSVAARIG